MTVDSIHTNENRVAKALPIDTRRSDRLATLTVGVAILIIGELSASLEWVSPLLLPAPSKVADTLFQSLSSGRYIPHILSTVLSSVGGFIAASVAAFVIGGLMISVPYLERVFLPYVVAFQTLPKIAVAPLVVIWMGFGNSAKVVIVMIVCFFPILINVLQGLRIRDRNEYELLGTLGASRWQLLTYLRLPRALPYVFAGLRLGIVFSLIGAVTAEFVGSRVGLGYLLLIEQGAFNVAGVFAILLLLMAIGLVLNAVVVISERKIAFWAAEVSNAPAA